MSAVYQSPFGTALPKAKRGFRVWLAWTLFIAIWLTAIFAAPFLERDGSLAFADAIYGFFAWLCHQIRERSFQIGGEPLAVCARCLGLYAGVFLGSLVYPTMYKWQNTNAPRRLWLLIAPLPLILDFGLTFFGVWENTHFSRFVTALPFGCVVPFYLLPALLDLSEFIAPLKSPFGEV